MYENHLYNNTVTLNFETGRHRYYWVEENLEVKSVTTALRVINKPALINWAAGCASDYMRENLKPGVAYDELQLAELLDGAKDAHNNKRNTAASLGSLLHKWIEDYINGEDPGIPVNEKLQKSVKKFLKWVAEHNVKFLCAEQVIFSKKYIYTGTTDFICKIDGNLYIGDLKTSKDIYTEMLIQTAAYRYARTEEFPKEKYEGQIILKIGSDGSFDMAIVRGRQVYEKLFRAFIYALELSNHLDDLKGYRPERKM